MHKQFFRNVSRRALLSNALLLGNLLIASMSLASPDLKWDLSYQTALKNYPIGDNEFMSFWPSRYPKRPIHDKLASYAGDEIEASLLIEQPDGHTGDPSATWFIKTKSSAQACSFHPKHLNEPCKQLDPARTEAFIREVMNFAPLQFAPSNEAKIGDLGGQPILLNYMGFVSVYVDGRALQRPIAILERSDSALAMGKAHDEQAGRLSRALAKALLTPQEYQQREMELTQQVRQRDFNEAVRKGDLDTMRALLDQGARFEEAGNTGSPAIAIAAQAGQKDAVEFLLQRGASIDATESSALKAAVRAGNGGMVDYLLSKGANIDPPKTSLNAYGKIYETALGAAVSTKNLDMARLLISRGAEVNAPQSRPIIAVAAVNRDLAMMDLLIVNGAKPDLEDESNHKTALMLLMDYAGNLGGWPKEEAKQRAILQTEAELEKVVRKLVAAGADVNRLDRICQTAYGEAQTRHSEGMMRLLVELGADPELHKQCWARRKVGDKGGREGAEGRARIAIATQVRDALKNGDYKNLESLYRTLNQETARTPAGIWQLAEFYGQFRLWPKRSRDGEYWASEEKRAKEWEKQFPQSVPARIFHAYVLWNRALSFRGDGAGASIKKEDAYQVTAAASEAFDILQSPLIAASKDPEKYRALVAVLPYLNRPAAEIDKEARKAMRIQPYYHELYFTAANYLLPKWGGSNNMVDWLAKSAVAATAEKEGRSLYARIYWYLDQVEYKGSLFAKSEANWGEMRSGFEDLVRQYPDPWNLNAFAYFACMAQDYKTMNVILARIGDQLVFQTWVKAGGVTYEECRRHGDAGAAFTSPAKQYEEFISRAHYLRRIARYAESLQALQEAEKIDQKRGRPSMMTQYNLGWTLAELGRHAEAVEAFTLGMQSQPEYPFAYWRRGLSLESLGRTNEARDDFDKTARLIEAANLKLTDEPEFVARFRSSLQRYGIDKKHTSLKWN